MNKKQKDLYAKYKKSNKERRKVLVKNAGFKTEAFYLLSLGVKVEKVIKKVTKKVPVKKVIKLAPIKAKTKSSKAKKKKDSERTDYVIAFDTTGSMSGFIHSVRKQVEDLINKLFDNSSDLRIKIVAFGDYCDMTSKKTFGSAYQETKLTDNRKELIEFVRSAENTSGGDSDEFYELVIQKINKETPWRDGKRAVLLIGDANPHPIGYTYHTYINQSNIDWKTEAKNAKKLGIQYDTLRIHNSITWYKELSDITGGACMEFANQAKVSTVIEGTVYARSSSTAYATTLSSVTASGDGELIGAFKSINTLLDE